MRLTKKQESVMANRFWQLGEKHEQAVLRKGFVDLKYSQFYKIINARRPNKIVWKGPKLPPAQKRTPYIKTGQQFDTCFMSLNEDEQIEFRKGLPIPKETKDLFIIGRLSAYYNNPNNGQ